MTKITTFLTNGQPTLTILKGEYSLIYFTFTYANSPELFYHSYNAALVPKVRLPNITGGYDELPLAMVSYFPACTVLTLTPDQKNTLLVGDKLNMEVTLYDVSDQVHVASRPASLFVKQQLFP